jgi:hypothetical protein
VLISTDVNVSKILDACQARVESPPSHPEFTTA